MADRVDESATPLAWHKPLRVYAQQQISRSSPKPWQPRCEQYSTRESGLIRPPTSAFANSTAGTVWMWRCPAPAMSSNTRRRASERVLDAAELPRSREQALDLTPHRTGRSDQTDRRLGPTRPAATGPQRVSQ